MQILSKVKAYIESKTLAHYNDKIVVGVSGGADSMALLDILIQLNYECIAAHCNFHLRGNESDRDCIFVKNYCATNNIEFVYTDFDTKKYMEEKAVSLEMAARELRYTWFDEIRAEYNADKIAVAHHQDDSVETVLINLIRGTGIKGLTGIPPVNGNIIRPLLCLHRKEIIEYLKSRQIDFVEDSTNSEDVYVRNKIRLNVIPLLQTINPSVVQAVSKTSENLLSTDKIYSKVIRSTLNKIFINNRINIDLLLKEEESRTILFEILHPYGFNTESIIDIFNSLSAQSGKTFYSKEYRLIKDRDSLILEKIAEKDNRLYTIGEQQKEIDLPIRLKLEYFSKNSSMQIEKSRDIVYLDKSTLTFPLTIRHWEKGDKFVPFGMKGAKKVSDYFSDRKFSLIDKEKAWLLCSENKIVWIVGERADDRFRITDKTSEIVKITFIKN